MKKIFPNYRKEKITTKILKKKFNKKLSLDEKKIFEDFLNLCRTTGNEGTVKDSEAVLYQIRDFMEKPLTELTTDDLIKFCAVLNSSQDIGEWKKYDARIILKKFVKFCYKDYSSRFGELNTIIKNKNIKSNPTVLNSSTLITDKELERMLRVAPTLRDRLVLILSYELGARPHELRLMKWSQVKLDNVPAEVTLITDKGNKSDSRTLPINESTIHFQRWKQEYPYTDLKPKDDFVFPNPTLRNKPLSTNSFSYIIPKIAKLAGIEKRVWGYLLRHSRLTEIRRKGMQEKIAMMFGGHSDPDVCDLYTHLNQDDLRSEVLAKLYNIQELTPEQKDEYKKRIEELEKEMEDFRSYKEFMKAMFENMKTNPEKFKMKKGKILMQVPSWMTGFNKEEE